MPQLAKDCTPALVADIGGTNARFATVDLASERWLGEWRGQTTELPDIYSALEAAFEHLPGAREASKVCLAIAAPVDQDQIKVSNGTWRFSQRELQQHFRWPALTLMNDFLAAAYGATTLQAQQFRVIGPAVSSPRKLTSAVIGPGTGLGVAALIPTAFPPGTVPNKTREHKREASSASWSAIATEGGHARFAPFDAEEIALLEVLSRELRSVQREDLLSGRGLCNLYRALAQVHDLKVPEVQAPADIPRLAMADSSSHARRCLERFCAILGTVAADVAMDLGVRGTVFLAGGILPRIADFLTASPFRERFENHLQFGDYLQSIHTVLITEPRLGLIGAAQVLRRLGSEGDLAK